MQIKRYFQQRKVNKMGLAPIIMTASWDGLRTELYPNEKAHQEAWDEKWKKVKPKQTYTTRINRKLDAGENAITAFYDAAKLENQPVTIAQIRAVFYQAIELDKEPEALDSAVQNIVHLLQPVTETKAAPAEPVDSEFFA